MVCRMVVHMQSRVVVVVNSVCCHGSTRCGASSKSVDAIVTTVRGQLWSS